MTWLTDWQGTIGEFGQIIGIWIAVGLTLAMLSFLYKDNPFFKFAEHLYLGISNGYYIVYVWQNVVKPELLGRIMPKLIFNAAEQPELYAQHPKYYYIIPGLLGLFLLMRLIPATSWWSRWSLAFYIGWGSGVAIPKYLTEYILAQAIATFSPLFGPVAGVIAGSAAASAATGNAIPFTSYVNNWLLFAGVLSALVYFFFSVEHKGTIGTISKIGIWTLMLAFGASFGSTVMARVSLFIGRARFLVQEGSSEAFGYAFPIQLGLIIVIAVVALLLQRNGRAGQRT
ncbi:MAG: hypothetical protein HRF49_01600 [bacterium]|jgi:hypothetical protein